MRRYDGRHADERAAGLKDAVASAKRGDLVVVHGDGAYVVVTDAFSERGVASLRELKQRPQMNVPVLVPRIETAEGIAQLTGGGGRVARELMRACWPGALTIVAPTQPLLAWTCAPAGVVAMRMPLHPWTLDVVRAIGPTAVVPAHDHDAEPVTSIDAAEQLLGDRVAVMLDGGPCLPDQMSSVVDVTGEQATLVRIGAFGAEYLRRMAPDLHLPPE